MSLDLVDISSARRDPKTNAILVQLKSSQVGKDESDAPGFDDAPLFNALGVSAIPWGADERGNAQALVCEDVAGSTGVCVSPRDTRVANVVEELGPGETCIHATGPGFGTRIFLKKQLIAAIIDDDCVLTLDRENKKFAVSLFGLHLELSAENGFLVSADGAQYQIKGGAHSLIGSVILGGRTPLGYLFMSPTATPPLGVAPGVPIVPLTAAPGVFIGVG